MYTSLSLFLGRPLDRFPCLGFQSSKYWGSRSSGILLTCPNQRSRLPLIISANDTWLMLFSKHLNHFTLNILCEQYWWNDSNLLVWAWVVFHTSHPYINKVRTAATYIRIFTGTPMFLFFICCWGGWTPQLILDLWIRTLISLSILPFESAQVILIVIPGVELVMR